MSPQKRIRKLRAERDDARAKLAVLQNIEAPDDGLIRIVVQISQGGIGGQAADIFRPEELGDMPAEGLAQAIKQVAYEAAMGFAGGAS